MKTTKVHVRAQDPGMASQQMPLAFFDSEQRIIGTDRRGPEHVTQLPQSIQRKFPSRGFSILHDRPHADLDDLTAGRMVICGRMADVCAALERMAAGQPPQHV